MFFMYFRGSICAVPILERSCVVRRKIRGLRVASMALLLAATTSTAPAQTFATVYSFCSNCVSGGNPYSTTLVQGANGSLYGTTWVGGVYGAGTIFEVTTTGTLTTLFNFSCVTGGCKDGIDSYGGLLLATDGNFYGVTDEGGEFGAGTVFQMTADGKLTTLHNFKGSDGAYPRSGVIQATDGNLYGTTFGGGAYSSGTVFVITTDGVFKTLYNFCTGSCFDGAGPNGMIQAADGNFYGTTYGGGGFGTDSPCYPLTGGGTFFQLSPLGTLTTLATFCQPNGFFPSSAPVQAADGNFYGTTFFGGSYVGADENGLGTVYQMTPTGSITTLYSFCLLLECLDGLEPDSLILGTDGNFYGITGGGGANGEGTIFEITASGQFTVLNALSDKVGGVEALLQGTNGAFYGTTYFGGKYGVGSVFSLDTGLSPFVKTIPASGAEGTNVVILGTDLTGATDISFNGTAARFKVVSGSEITTTVPAGASSGTVTVKIASGTTLSSNVAFQIP